MIEPLRYYKEKSPTFALKCPIYCSVCVSKGRRHYSNIACKFCTHCEKLYFLCLSCDEDIHRYGTNSRHIRRLIVIGPGIRKRVITRGDAINYPLPLDLIKIRYNVSVYNNNKIIHQEPYKTTSFICGLSGKSIHIQILGARNLLAADVNGTSDPFIISMYNGKKLSSTRMRPRTCNPNWSNETIIIPIDNMLEKPRNVVKSQEDLLRFEVYDYDWFTNNDLLGNIEIKKDHLIHLAIQSNQQAICLPLTNRRFHGLIGIKMGFNNDYLNLKLCRAEGLPIASPIFGLCNPFVKVFFNEKCIGKTSIIKHSLDPEWLNNNEFKFSIIEILKKEKELLNKKGDIDLAKELKNFDPYVDRSRNSGLSSMATANLQNNNKKKLQVNDLQKIIQSPVFHNQNSGFTKQNHENEQNFSNAHAFNQSQNINQGQNENNYTLKELSAISLFTLEIYHQSSFSLQTKFLGRAYISIDYLREILPKFPKTIEIDKIYKKEKFYSQINNSLSSNFSSKFPWLNPYSSKNSNSPLGEGNSVGHLDPILDNEQDESDNEDTYNYVDHDPVYNNINISPSQSPKVSSRILGFHDSTMRSPLLSMRTNKPTGNLSPMSGGASLKTSKKGSARFSLRHYNNMSNSTRKLKSFRELDLETDQENIKNNQAEMDEYDIRNDLEASNDENDENNQDYEMLDVESESDVSNDESNNDDDDDEGDYDDRDAPNNPDSAFNREKSNNVNVNNDNELMNGKSMSYYKKDLAILLPDNEFVYEYNDTDRLLENVDNNKKDNSKYTKDNSQNEKVIDRLKNRIKKFLVSKQEKNIIIGKEAEPETKNMFTQRKFNFKFDFRSVKNVFGNKTDEFKWSKIRHFKIERSLDVNDHVVEADVEDRGYIIVRLIMSNRGHAIVGLDESVRRMSLGERSSVLVRYDYAYGNFTVGAHIPPRANMIFNVQLLSINNQGQLQMPVRVLLRFYRFLRRWRKKTFNYIISYLSRLSIYQRIMRKESVDYAKKADNNVFVDETSFAESNESSDDYSDASSSEKSDSTYSNSFIHIPVDVKIKKNLNRSVLAGTKLMWGYNHKTKVNNRKTASQKKEEKRIRKQIERKSQKYYLPTITEEGSMTIPNENRRNSRPQFDSYSDDSEDDIDEEANFDDEVAKILEDNKDQNELRRDSQIISRRDSDNGKIIDSDLEDSRRNSKTENRRDSNASRRVSLINMFSSISRKVSEQFRSSKDLGKSNEIEKVEDSDGNENDNVVNKLRRTSFDPNRKAQRISHGTIPDALIIQHELRRKSESIESISSLGSTSVIQQAALNQPSNKKPKIKSKKNKVDIKSENQNDKKTDKSIDKSIENKVDRSNKKMLKNKIKSSSKDTEKLKDMTEEEEIILNQILGNESETKKKSPKFKIIKK